MFKWLMVQLVEGEYGCGCRQLLIQVVVVGSGSLRCRFLLMQVIMGESSC